MITTTLNRIRKYSSSETGWVKLLNGLGKTAADDEPFPFAKILEINGLDRALWCCPAEPQYNREWRLLLVAYVKRDEHRITDPERKNMLDVAERYANGKATEKEMSAAWDRDAIRDTAWIAARDAVWGIPWDAKRDAAVEAERKWQEQEFLRVVTETEARTYALTLDDYYAAYEKSCNDYKRCFSTSRGANKIALKEVLELAGVKVL